MGSRSEALLVLQPSTCFHCLHSPPNEYALSSLFSAYTTPVWVSHIPSSDSEGASTPALRRSSPHLHAAASPAEPAQSPAPTYPTPGRANSAGRSPVSRWVCGAAVAASVLGEGEQHANHPELFDQRKVALRADVWGKSAQAARGWHAPGALSGCCGPGRRRGSRLQAECARIPSLAPRRCRSPRPLPPRLGASKNADRIPPQDRGLWVRAHALPCSGRKSKVGALIRLAPGCRAASGTCFRAAS